MGNYFYVTSEGAVSHNVLYYQQLPITCYQLWLYANKCFEKLPIVSSAFKPGNCVVPDYEALLVMIEQVKDPVLFSNRWQVGECKSNTAVGERSNPAESAETLAFRRSIAETFCKAISVSGKLLYLVCFILLCTQVRLYSSGRMFLLEDTVDNNNNNYK